MTKKIAECHIINRLGSYVYVNSDSAGIFPTLFPSPCLSLRPVPLLDPWVRIPLLLPTYVYTYIRLYVHMFIHTFIHTFTYICLYKICLYIYLVNKEVLHFIDILFARHLLRLTPTARILSSSYICLYIRLYIHLYVYLILHILLFAERWLLWSQTFLLTSASSLNLSTLLLYVTDLLLVHYYCILYSFLFNFQY